MHLTPELLWSLARVGAPSAVGDTVVVPITTHDLAANEGMTRLHRVAGGELVPLTTGPGSAPDVSPDGRSVAFLRKVGSRQQVHVMPLDGGEPRPVTDFPLGAGSPRWTPDGRILCHALLSDAGPTPGDTSRILDERADRKVSARVTEDRMYRFWDTWLTDGDRHHLFLVDPDGGEPIDLTPGPGMVWSLPATGDPIDDVSSSADGSTVVFAAAEPVTGPERARWCLWEVPTTGGDRRLLAEHPTGDTRRPRHLPDGSVLYGETRELDYYATPVRPTVVEPDGTVRTLVEDWDLSPDAWEVEPTTGMVVLTAEERGRVALFSLDPAGGTPVRIASDHTLTRPTPDGAGNVYLLRQSISRPPEVVVVPASGGTPTEVTRVNAEAIAALDLGAVSEHTVSGARGDEIQYFVVEPPDATEGPLPLVQLVHGGPHGTFGDMWHWRWNAHLFASRGHVAAMVNFHGSTSFGHEFAASIQGDWGTMPTEDVLAATDALVSAGRVDPDRMALAGGSYGGYLVAWMGGHTDRFKAIVAHAAVTNQGGMWATDSTWGLPRARGAAVWEDPTRVAEASPSNHYAAYVTPTLVVHGERDYRVPITQGLELYGVLKAKGVPARLVYYPDENHWILSPANSIHWYGEVLDWIERWTA